MVDLFLGRNKIIMNISKVSAFIIPGKNGEIARASLQITSMLDVKKSETIVIPNSTHKIETKIIKKIKHIKLLKINPALRPVEIMTSVHKAASEEIIIFFDGNASINSMNLLKIFEAYKARPKAVYCSALKNIGDIEGFVYGSRFSENGEKKPIISDEKRIGTSNIECLQYGCIIFPKKILSEISYNKPCSCIEEVSHRITETGNSIYCVNESFISYKGLINLGIEVKNV